MIKSITELYSIDRNHSNYVFNTDKLHLDVESCFSLSRYAMNQNLFGVRAHNKCATIQFCNIREKSRWFKEHGCLICHEKEIEYDEFKCADYVEMVKYYLINLTINVYEFVSFHECEFLGTYLQLSKDQVDEFKTHDCFCGYKFRLTDFHPTNLRQNNFIDNIKKLKSFSPIGAPTYYYENDHYGKVYSKVFFGVLLQNGKILNQSHPPDRIYDQDHHPTRDDTIVLRIEKHQYRDNTVTVKLHNLSNKRIQQMSNQNNRIFCNKIKNSYL